MNQDERIIKFIEDLDYDLYKDLFIFDPEEGEKVLEKAKMYLYEDI